VASFTLTVAGSTYTLGDDGSVTTTAGAFGTWGTDGTTTNQIVITPLSGAAISVPATWQFNADNQLCLMNGAAVLFNFSSGARPDFRMDNVNILHVSPTGALFEFPLVCTFALGATADLEVTIGTATSKIVGAPDSNAALFAYSFSDMGIAGPGYWLPFTGAWTRDTSNGHDDIHLVFQGKAGGAAFAFKLPSGATLSGKNQLFVSGFKNGGAWGIEIQSTLVIQKNFTLVFTLNNQTTSAGVKTTTIMVKAVLAPSNTSNLGAALDLFVTDQASPTAHSHQLSVSGKGHIAFGAAGLDITFAYTKSSLAGTPAVVAVAIGASFAWDNNKNALAITFNQAAGGLKTVTLTTNFTIEDKIRVQAYLNISQHGQTKGVYGALGIAF